MDTEYTLDHYRAYLAGMRRDGDKSAEAVARAIALIDAMTDAERANPDLIDSDARRRIAAVTHTDTGEVEKLLAEFRQVRAAILESMRLIKKIWGGSRWQRLKWVLGLTRFPPGLGVETTTEPTLCEKWVMSALWDSRHRPFAVELIPCGLLLFGGTSLLVAAWLQGQLGGLALVLLEIGCLFFSGLLALWKVERNGFRRWMDARDREIRELKDQQKRAEQSDAADRPRD
jgi:hypothetical protein